MGGQVHIAGAGLAGLACGLRLALGGAKVTLHEAAPHAGGRCRSHHDPVLDREIDNGNHLVLSANRAALAYLEEAGGADRMVHPNAAALPFHDLETGESWTLRPGKGRFPGWLFRPGRRVPGAGGLAHLGGLLRLARAGEAETVAGLMGSHPLYRRLWQPLAVSILNTPAETASARLFWRVVRMTLGAGGAGCRPLTPAKSLGHAFVEPALARLGELGAEIRYGARLRGITAAGHRISELRFHDRVVKLAEPDCAVLAIPDREAATVLPGLKVPDAHHAIVNAHFRLDRPARLPDGAALLGLVGGTAEWVFARGEVASVTVSAADELAARDAEEIAPLLWRDVAAALDLPAEPMPPCRVIKEKRATIAHRPDQMVRRPGATTPAANLFLAGDWTDTGLPCTIEGAILSGHRAAELALAATKF